MLMVPLYKSFGSLFVHARYSKSTHQEQARYVKVTKASLVPMGVSGKQRGTPFL